MRRCTSSTESKAHLRTAAVQVLSLTNGYSFFSSELQVGRVTAAEDSSTNLIPTRTEHPSGWRGLRGLRMARKHTSARRRFRGELVRQTNGGTQRQEITRKRRKLGCSREENTLFRKKSSEWFEGGQGEAKNDVVGSWRIVYTRSRAQQ